MSQGILEFVSHSAGSVVSSMSHRVAPSSSPKTLEVKGGRHSTLVAFALRKPAAPGSNLGVPKKIFLLLDVAELIDSIRTVQ